MVMDCILQGYASTYHLEVANSCTLNRSTPEDMLLECDFYAQRGIVGPSMFLREANSL